MVKSVSLCDIISQQISVENEVLTYQMEIPLSLYTADGTEQLFESVKNDQELQSDKYKTCLIQK